MLKNKIRLLIVEDSSFFVKRLVSIIGAADDIDIVGIADNGIEALDKIETLNPDVVTMDITMPLLDGIEVVRRVMKKRNVPIIMLSAHTLDGAADTFDALEAGAIDFLSKDVNDLSFDVVVKKIRAVVREKYILDRDTSSVPGEIKREKNYKIIIIGASTGGPIVVEDILSNLPANFAIPVLVVMHMPKDFVAHYVDRISKKIAINVSRLNVNKLLQPGVYIAPGGMNVEFNKAGKCQIVEAEESCIYKPNIDLALSSAAASFQDKVLGIILTGMGGDGLEGAKNVRKHKGDVWLQSLDSCSVAGMPMAIKNAGEFDRIYSVSSIYNKLVDLGV